MTASTEIEKIPEIVSGRFFWGVGGSTISNDIFDSWTESYHWIQYLPTVIYKMPTGGQCYIKE